MPIETSPFVHSRSTLITVLSIVVLFFSTGLAPSQGWSFEVINSSNQPTPTQPLPSNRWSLTTLPMGHGDAHIIGSPDGEISLVDTGSTETVSIVVRYLQQNSVDTIDRIIVTHPHWDHIGGVPKLLKAFQVGRIIRPDLNHSTDLVQRTERVIRRRDVPVRRPSRGETFPIGNGQEATVIHPASNPSGGLNSNSLAFHFSAGRTRFLMMGDVIGDSVENLLDQDLIPPSDVVKIAHHGNARGASDRFFQTVRPRLAIIPAPLRRHDPWGRPDPELLKRLKAHGIPTFQTGKTGRIQVRINQKHITSVSLGPTSRPAADGLEASP